MSSCFLCDCSYKFRGTEYDSYSISTEMGEVHKHMKYMPIMVGSSGFEINRYGDVGDIGTDQQHKNNKKQNYVSYRVKKLEFCCSYYTRSVDGVGETDNFPDYVLIFKVPFRKPVFDYYFTVLNNFMLFSEPECVLDYKVLQSRSAGNEGSYKYPRRFDITINKPFIVGPNDYVGVLYMFTATGGTPPWADASAKVWFDIV